MMRTSNRGQSAAASSDPEIQEKLRRSLEEVLDMEEQNLACPICGFRIAGVYGDRAGHIRVKCRKCKFEGILNLAYFRRIR